MPSKIVTLTEIGEIDISKHKQARYLKIRVDENGQVKITIPTYSKYQTALDFAKDKIEWIKNEQFKFSQIKKPIKEFKTKFRELELIPCEINKARTRISPTKILIYYPNTIASEAIEAYTNPEIQTLIKTTIEKTLRLEAKEYLPKRLEELALKHNLKYNGVRIKNTKTRWGSCSYQNNINLSSHLMKLPDYLIDYVILHELAHTIEKNHSEKFWQLLTNLLGSDAKIPDKELKQYKTSI